MTRKSSKSPCVEAHYEDYTNKWVKISHKDSDSYYLVDFHVKEGSNYIFYYKDYVQVAAKSAKNGDCSGAWYRTRVKKKDLLLTCVVGTAGDFKVLTTEQLNAVLDSLRNAIPVIK